MRWNPFAVEARVRRAVARVERRRRPVRLEARFLVKGLVLSALLAGAVVALASRYTLAVATQANLCLPPYRLWIIDKGDRRPERGAIFAFHAHGLAPVFADGTIIVKVLEGMPGDRVEVSEARTTINGTTVARGLQVAAEHGLDPRKYVRDGQVGQGRYWFFGRTADSFDSRYWGSVGAEQIIGKAYPLW